MVDPHFGVGDEAAHVGEDLVGGTGLAVVLATDQGLAVTDQPDFLTLAAVDHGYSLEADCFELGVGLLECIVVLDAEVDFLDEVVPASPGVEVG